MDYAKICKFGAFQFQLLQIGNQIFVEIISIAD